MVQQLLTSNSSITLPNELLQTLPTGTVALEHRDNDNPGNFIFRSVLGCGSFMLLIMASLILWWCRGMQPRLRMGMRDKIGREALPERITFHFSFLPLIFNRSK